MVHRDQIGDDVARQRFGLIYAHRCLHDDCNCKPKMLPCKRHSRPCDCEYRQFEFCEHMQAQEGHLLPFGAMSIVLAWKNATRKKTPEGTVVTIDPYADLPECDSRAKEIRNLIQLSKVGILKARRERGVCLWHPADRCQIKKRFRWEEDADKIGLEARRLKNGTLAHDTLVRANDQAASGDLAFDADDAAVLALTRRGVKLSLKIRGGNDSKG